MSWSDKRAEQLRLQMRKSDLRHLRSARTRFPEPVKVFFELSSSHLFFGRRSLPLYVGMGLIVGAVISERTGITASYCVAVAVAVCSFTMGSGASAKAQPKASLPELVMAPGAFRPSMLQRQSENGVTALGQRARKTALTYRRI